MSVAHGVYKTGPLLYVGELSHRIYLTHRYRQLDDNAFEVVGSKIDITDQVGRCLAELDRRGLELRPVEPTAPTNPYLQLTL